MINNITLVGRIIKKPEIRYTESNKAICNFTIAVNRTYKNAEGIYETDFINCVVYGKIAETTNEYTDKGDTIGIRGRLQVRNYENKEGNKKYITEVVAEQVSFISTGNKNNNEQKEIKEEIKEIKKEEDPFEEFAKETENLELPF